MLPPADSPSGPYSCLDRAYRWPWCCLASAKLRSTVSCLPLYNRCATSLSRLRSSRSRFSHLFCQCFASLPSFATTRLPEPRSYCSGVRYITGFGIKRLDNSGHILPWQDLLHAGEENLFTDLRALTAECTIGEGEWMDHDAALMFGFVWRLSFHIRDLVRTFPKSLEWMNHYSEAI